MLYNQTFENNVFTSMLAPRQILQIIKIVLEYLYPSAESIKNVCNWKLKNWPEMMTRAILASCLWHFLPLLLHSRQISNGSCTRFPAFAEATAVKARICSQLISCNFTNFWLRNNLYRDNAPVHTRIFVTVDKLVVPIKHVPQHS